MDSDDEYGAFTATMSEARTPCDICGRQFNPDALRRHTPICAKSSSKKRKVFDTTKQRIEGTDIKAVPKSRSNTQKVRASVNNNNYRSTASEKIAPKKGGDWRAKHEQFIATIRAARGVQAAIDSGKPLPPPPPPTINPDYVQCEYCSRRFNVTAAERHIPFCKEQQMRKQINNNTVGKSAMKTRTAYKAPRPKARTATSAQNTSGYGSVTSPPNRPPAGRTGSGRSSSSSRAGTRGNNLKNTHTLNGNSRGYGDSYDQYDGSVSPGTGAALRTGRTAESYTDARELSAKQKVQALSKKFPSNDSIHRASYNRLEMYDDAVDSRAMQTLGRHHTSLYSTHWSPRYSSYNSPSPDPSPSHHSTRRPPSGSRGYRGDSEESRSAGKSNRQGSAMARFCHECGTKYPVSNAKFCCECGIRRITF